MYKLSLPIKLIIILLLVNVSVLVYSQEIEEEVIPIDRAEIGSIPDSPEVFSYAVIEEKPVFQGGDKALIEYIKENTQYPIMIEGVDGRVFLSFVINIDGRVSDVKVLRGMDPLFDSEAIRVVELMPKWSPGSHQGKKVKVAYMVPVSFFQGMNEDNKDKVGKRLTAPQFQGGDDALVKYIRENTIYPQEAYNKGIEGRVSVSFTVDATGLVTRIELLKGVYQSLDEEALRVVNSMPNWIAGTKEGKAIEMRYQVPIIFDFRTKIKE